jgi:hypothetical protein
MLHAFVVLVSSRFVCTVYSYACVSAMFIDCWMLCGFKRVSAFEFATMYTFRLYFLGCVPVVVYVCVWECDMYFWSSWCVGCGLSMVCASNLEVLVLLR